MKKFLGKLLVLAISTLSLSSCVLFNVKYEPYDPENKYNQNLEYTISEKKVELNVGDTKQLDALIDGKAVPFNLPWKTNDDLVATVTSSGKVTAVGGGTCLISVRFKEDVVANALVIVNGPRKSPKNGALGKFFQKYGKRIPVMFMDTFEYNKYTFNGEETKNGKLYTYELLYIDDHTTEKPFKIEVRTYEGDMTYYHIYRFQENKFFEADGTIGVYNEGYSISSFNMLDSSYYATDATKTIYLAEGKTFEKGNAKAEKDSTTEQKDFAFNMLNDGVQYMYDVMEQNGAKKVKLF